MPKYQIDGQEIDIRLGALLLDTGILVAKIDKSDSLHDRVAEYLESEAREKQLVIPVVVVIEAWGKMVGGRRFNLGLQLLEWISDPGSDIVLIPQRGEEFPRVHEAMKSQAPVDCVDLLVSRLAADLGRRCNINPCISVVTCDTRDFFRLAGQFRFDLVTIKPDTWESFQFPRN